MSSDPKPVGGQWHKAARGELSPPKGASEETLVPQLFTASVPDPRTVQPTCPSSHENFFLSLLWEGTQKVQSHAAACLATPAASPPPARKTQIRTHIPLPVKDLLNQITLKLAPPRNC